MLELGGLIRQNNENKRTITRSRGKLHPQLVTPILSLDSMLFSRLLCSWTTTCARISLFMFNTTHLDKKKNKCRLHIWVTVSVTHWKEEDRGCWVVFSAARVLGVIKITRMNGNWNVFRGLLSIRDALSLKSNTASQPHSHLTSEKDSVVRWCCGTLCNINYL